MANELMLIVGCDCDPDRLLYGGSRLDIHRPAHQWRGVSEGIEQLEEMLERVEHETEVKPRLIYCVRSDLQMKEIYGSAGWLLSEYLSLWRELERRGHEIAWHPHLWRWSAKAGCWYQEVEDRDWVIGCLEAGFAEFTEIWGNPPFTCHMGWTFHNTISMRTINRLGLKMDFSACPGVFFKGGPGAGGTILDNRIDWRGAPRKWYRPSENDYRRPRGGNEAELEIVEIPKFTSEAGLLRAAKELANRKKAGAEPAAAAFLQVTVVPLLYRQIIKERLDCAEAEPFFATYFHPDELLRKKAVSAKSFLHSAAHMQKNMVNVIEMARKRGRDVLFVTGPEAVDFITARG
jgi:hypothetical protein